MPQGKLKTKVQLPKGAKQKQKSEKKDMLRKGHRTIAPKKSRLIEASKVKRGLEKQLKASIEQDAMSRAAHAEPKTLTILKSSAPSGSSESKPGASKSKKKT
ncbi:UPF0390 protein zgc136864-like [Babylonia areolata]|uniref:UPF0390 protein zgc136864-like n=1 Tax=Babylonia areolata TaxID=304850 RepID=UPI003FD1F9AC